MCGDGAADAQKNELKPWQKKCWCIPERDAARFVAQMEEVLDVYTAPDDPDEPVVCMDEAARQLTADIREPLPLAPGRGGGKGGGAAREDYHYERRGTAAVFLFFDPFRGWRRASASDTRTRSDWAHEVRRLLEEDYPDAKRVTLAPGGATT